MNYSDSPSVSRVSVLSRQDAANDEHGAVRLKSAPSFARDASSGWDPFEVWRTRVRDARRDALPNPIR
jgi:hypothetical protein